jgi:membrane protease YdiL (CAAX protease family)
MVFLAAEAIQIIIIATLQTICIAMNLTLSQSIDHLISVIGVLGCGIAFFFWYRYETSDDYNLGPREIAKVKNIGLIVMLGISCQFFVSGTISLIQPYFVKMFDDYTVQMEQLFDGNIIVVILLLAIIAPVTEELVFRGVILHISRRYIPFYAANILQAVLFGLYHWNLIQGIYAGIVALLFGYIGNKYKSILAPILLHMSVNISSFLMILFPDNNFIYIAFAVIGGILIISLVHIIRKSEVLNYENNDMVFYRGYPSDN